jgi:GPI mannosyltransferase 1 subunit M
VVTYYYLFLSVFCISITSDKFAQSTHTTTHTTTSFLPQIVLGFSSLGIAPYDLTFALFSQTFCFVAFNKVMTAQYFTWYLCLLPLCSDRIQWSSRRMLLSLGFLLVSILTWLGSAFTLEMLGWRSHRQVWMASVLFFVANVNLLVAILNGYRVDKAWRSLSDTPGEGWSQKVKAS